MNLLCSPLLGQITLCHFLHCTSWFCGSIVPSVQLDQALVRGFRHTIATTIPPLEQDHFLGIPFAQPPLGNLRFAAPQPVQDDPAKVILATKFGPACVQPLDRPSFADLGRLAVSEDCLTVNIVRPSGITRSARLPVAVWIYGGGFRTGQSSIYAGDNIVAQSTAMDEPIIYVSLNYRLNSFGFLASSDIESRAKEVGDVALNAGLLDQRLALQWVKANIEAFGGDPDKVTVFGESAGAISIGAHLIAQEGNSETLFHAAILESGSPSGPSTPPPSALDHSFARFASSLGCTAGDASVIDCLRALSTDELLAATTVSLEGRGLGETRVEDAPPFNLVIDGDFYNKRPSESLKAGKVKSVPIITGTNLDEGTMFGPRNVKSEEGFRNTVEAIYAYHNPLTTPQIIDTLASLYPDIPSEGSPYPNPSGHSLPLPPLPFDSHHRVHRHDLRHASSSNYSPSFSEEPQERLMPIPGTPDDRIFPPFDSNQFKRLASVFGDLIFESPRRALLETLQEKQNVKTSARRRRSEGQRRMEGKVMEAEEGRTAGRGRGRDTGLPVEDAGNAHPSWSYHFRHPSVTAPRHLGVHHAIEIPYAFAAFNELPGETGDVSRFISSAWIRFVNRLNPNAPGLPMWPRYYAGDLRSGEAGHILQVRGGNMTVIKDDWRREPMKWLAYDAEWNKITER